MNKKTFENIKIFSKRRKKDLGSGYKEIAKKFGVSPAAIGHIVRKSTWRWCAEEGINIPDPE